MGQPLALGQPARGGRRPRWVLLLCAGLAGCSLLLAGCATGSPKAPAKLALVIGNAAYENVIPLKNPTNDADDMCAALQKLGFKTLCHTNVRDRAEFDTRVREYVAQLDASSVGVFHYSGHGVQAGLTNYLIPTQIRIKAATDNPTRALYSVDELFDRLGKKRPVFQLVILDACREDLFSPPERRAGRAPANPATPDGRSTLVRALEGVAGASSGLQPIKDAPASTIVLYATASKDVTYDGNGRNGPLTKHVLEHIGTKGITVEDFIKRVTLGVEQETLDKYKRRKTPYTYGSFSGKFCFGGCPPPPPPPPIPVPAVN